MDEVTRPKRAAKRRSGTTALNDEIETDEESLPSDAVDSTPESDDDAKDELIILENVSKLTEPDPRASRHSTRAAAQVVVNYNTKQHPQDYGVPGFRRRARGVKPPNVARSSGASQRSEQRRRTRTGSPEVVIYDSKHENVGTRPRKKLRVLDDDRERSSKKAKRSNQKVKIGNRIGDQPPDFQAISSEGIETVVEKATPGSKPIKVSHDPIDTDSVSNNTGTPISSGRHKTEMMARNALSYFGSESIVGDTEQNTLDDLARVGALPFAEVGKGAASDGQNDDDSMMIDDHGDSHQGEAHGEAENALVGGDTPVFDTAGDVGVTASRPMAGPQQSYTNETSTQHVIDHAFSSSSEDVTQKVSHALQTRKNILESVHKIRSAQDLQSSHTLAHLSRKSTSSRTLVGDNDHDANEREYRAPSAFEDEFAITEKVNEHQRTSSEGDIEASYSDLAASEQECAYDHTTSSASVANVDGAATGSRSQLESKLLNQDQRAPSYTSDPVEPIQRQVRESVHGTESHYGSPITPDSLSIGAGKETPGLDDALLKALASSQRSRPDALVSSDPTTINDEDPELD